MMRKLFRVAIVALILGLPVVTLRAQDDGLKAQKQLRNARHKEERVALKLRKKYWQQSIKGQPLPKSERVRMQRQMDREARELRERQKDEQQDYKDLQRAMKEIEKQL
jgi:hypothetical protein